MMENFIYLTGAVYLASMLVRAMFWAVDIIEGRR